jgi:hypothetical protein
VLPNVVPAYSLTLTVVADVTSITYNVFVKPVAVIKSPTLILVVLARVIT